MNKYLWKSHYVYVLPDVVDLGPSVLLTLELDRMFALVLLNNDCVFVDPSRCPTPTSAVLLSDVTQRPIQRKMMQRNRQVQMPHSLLHLLKTITY